LPQNRQKNSRRCSAPLQGGQKDIGGKNLESGSHFRHSGGSRNPEPYLNLLILKQKALTPGLRLGDDSVGFSTCGELIPFFTTLLKTWLLNASIAIVVSFLDKLCHQDDVFLLAAKYQVLCLH
jgi:hypothetical protein